MVPSQMGRTACESGAKLVIGTTGADVMKRIAAPQVGGVFSAMILTLLVIPPIYVIWRWHTQVKKDTPIHPFQS